MADLDQTRDIIVIGASAGGVDALRRLVGQLPADLPAAVFVVQHVGDRSEMAGILDRAGPLPATHPSSGEAIRRGCVFVAPSGTHMLVHDHHILLRRGPRENLARPAIDPLFRSAASSYGPRTVGVVLTGFLNDGTAGLRAIKRCGGVAVVQDPRDADVPDMPRSALRHVDVDHVAPLASLGALLDRLVREPVDRAPEIPVEIRLEAAVAAQELASIEIEDRLGTRSPFSCPECHGSLWELAEGDLLRYRCHVGHAFTADAVLHAQERESEGLLWALLRSQRERAALSRRMAERERMRNRPLAGHLLQRALDYEEGAEMVGRLLEHAGATRPTAAMATAELGENEPLGPTAAR
jgi:two-component system chemotaxis response regulator CheB